MLGALGTTPCSERTTERERDSESARARATNSERERERERERESEREREREKKWKAQQNEEVLFVKDITAPKTSGAISEREKRERSNAHDEALLGDRSIL